MQGQRVADDHGVWLYEPGDFGLYKGEWHGKSPNGLLAGLKKHSVVEHDDRSITVSPSILVSTNDATWHGFLESGVWREC